MTSMAAKAAVRANAKGLPLPVFDILLPKAPNGLQLGEHASLRSIKTLAKHH